MKNQYEQQMAHRVAIFATTLLGPQPEDAQALTGGLTDHDLLIGSMHATASGLHGISVVRTTTYTGAAQGAANLLKEIARIDEWDLPANVYTGAQSALLDLGGSMDTGIGLNPDALGFGSDLTAVFITTTMAAIASLAAAINAPNTAAGEVLARQIINAKIGPDAR